MTNSGADTTTLQTVIPGHQAGAFVCIVGPSGAGKDSLLAEARKGILEDEKIIFPRRLVTRAKNEAEDHETITQQAFDAGIQAEEFCLHWKAHGLSYALPLAVDDIIAAGNVVVCNVSRSVIPQIKSKFARVHVVLITAPPTVIAERLRNRGRETSASIATRLERGYQLSADLKPDLTILNVGPLAIGGKQLIKFLRQIVQTRKL